MRLSYFLLSVALILLIGLNLAGQGITSVVGDGPWQITKLEWKEDKIVLALMGWEADLPKFDIINWVKNAFREIINIF